MAMTRSDNADDQRHAAMALGNIAANEGNHPQLVVRGAIQALVALSKSPEVDVREYAGFALANLASNADYLDAIGAKGGIDPLVKLAGSANVQTQVRVEKLFVPGMVWCLATCWWFGADGVAGLALSFLRAECSRSTGGMKSRLLSEAAGIQTGARFTSNVRLIRIVVLSEKLHKSDHRQKLC